tara:strand:- start:168 stop:692 length:525 start_codon:yes stop_codon:yes gene_type:complete
MKRFFKAVGIGIIFYLIISWGLYLSTNIKKVDAMVFGYLAFILSFFISFLKKNKKEELNIKPIKEEEFVEKLIESFDFVVTESEKENKNGVPRESYIEDLEQYDHLKLEIEEDNRIIVFWEGVDIGYVQDRFVKKISKYISLNYKLDVYVKKLYKKQGKLLCIAIIEVRKLSKL